MADSHPPPPRRRRAVSRRALLVYVALVGAPLIGLFAILRVGERILAPPRVAGAFVLEGPFAERGRCTLLEIGSGRVRLEISQSGRYLQIAFEDAAQTRFEARLRDSLIVVPLPVPASMGCPSPATLLLVLDDGGNSLTGSISHDDCAECPAVPIRAVRLPAAREP